MYRIRYQSSSSRTSRGHRGTYPLQEKKKEAPYMLLSLDSKANSQIQNPNASNFPLVDGALRQKDSSHGRAQKSMPPITFVLSYFSDPFVTLPRHAVPASRPLPYVAFPQQRDRSIQTFLRGRSLVLNRSTSTLTDLTAQRRNGPQRSTALVRISSSFQRRLPRDRTASLNPESETKAE